MLGHELAERSFVAKRTSLDQGSLPATELRPGDDACLLHCEIPNPCQF